MLFIDAKNVFLIGGAAVAVLAGAYVIWGPSERSRRKRTRRGNILDHIWSQEMKFCMLYSFINIFKIRGQVNCQ